MDLFDLEIPIRATGLANVDRDFHLLERAGEQAAARTEAAVGRMAPPPSVAEGFRRVTQSATATAPAIAGLSESVTRATVAEEGLANAQTEVRDGLSRIARDILAAQSAFKAGSLSADGLTTALRTARQQASDLSRQFTLTRSQGEAFSAIMSATVPALKAADGAMVLIDQDVRLASAAFKAGTISAEDYAVALETARAQAISVSQGTQLAGTELAAFNRILSATAPAVGPARQGLGTMRSALATMAVASLGARSSIGSLLSGLALFAGGSGIALGVIAGLAGIVAILDALTASGRQAAEQQRKLREELRKTTEERRRAADPSITRDEQLAAIASQRALLQNRIAQEQLGAPIVGAGGLIVGHAAPDLREIERLRGELQKLDADAATARQTFRAAEQDAADERIEHLAALVRAGTATVADQQALRDALTASKAGLAALGDEYRKTNDGIETAARLTQRITTIESAFGKAATATGSAQGDVAASLRDRTTALIALQALEGPTVERWQALTDRAAQLRAELDSGNLTLDQRVDRLRELQQIEQAQDFGVPDVEHIQQRGPDIRRTPPQPVAPVLSIPGGEGSLFGQMVQQIEAGGASAEEAIQQVNEKLTAAGEQLSEGVADALTSAFSGNTDFGAGMLKALGSMVIRFGVAVSQIGALMAKALKALSSLNPVAAIAAGAALVALGALLSSAAKSSFTPGGSGGATLQPITITTTLPSAGTATAPQAAGTNTSAAAVRPVTPVTVNQTIIGINDPAAQRAVALMVQKAAGRGAG